MAHFLTLLPPLPQAAAGGRALAASTYRFLFPVLQAVLSSPCHTPLHDAALGVLSLHVAPGQDVPRQQSLRLLYHLLAIIPAYRWGAAAAGEAAGKRLLPGRGAVLRCCAEVLC